MDIYKVGEYYYCYIKYHYIICQIQNCTLVNYYKVSFQSFSKGRRDMRNELN